jgi:putative transposase
MILTYKYRLLPNKRQHAALAAICETQRLLYNCALEERIDCYRKTGKGRSYIDQCQALTECRRDLPEMGALPANLQRWTLKRVDEAYGGFFRRCQRGGKAGFPRFRGKGWWSSFGFAEFRGIGWDGKRLRFKGLPGGLAVHLHRPLPADIRSCVIKRRGRQWWVCFQVALADVEKRVGSTAVGLDLGLNALAYQSDGVVIANPRFSRRTEHGMRRRQRALARCKRGSRNRRKAKDRVARLHSKIVNQRTSWLHQQSARIVRCYDLIVAEDLNVSGMVRNPHLARSIADASWSKFLGFVDYKAARAGSHLIGVDAKNTSQKCSGCGQPVPKSIAVRTHACPYCALVIDRDWNASLNILAAGIGGGAANVADDRKRRPRNMLEAPARELKV